MEGGRKARRLEGVLVVVQVRRGIVFWERRGGGEGRKMSFYTHQNDVVLMLEVLKRRHFDAGKK